MTKVKNVILEASTIFDSGFNCCQAVFTPFAMQYGMTEELSLKISSSFGAGMSYNGETCGAVVGAHMVIGMRNGYNDANDIESKENARAMIKEFRAKFTSKYGSCICKDLLGANPGVAEDFEYLKKNNVFEKNCPGFVKESVEMLNSILDR